MRPSQSFRRAVGAARMPVLTSLMARSASLASLCSTMRHTWPCASRTMRP
ncbi:Uncharacterised protein [Bordetella pertussis]|nr:Uncharacterised protein [Bordetella pertussis]